MRRDPGEWAKLSALASLVAFGALVTMILALQLVQGLMWEDGIADPTLVHEVVALGLAVPFLAAPGVVVGWAAGARGWRLALVGLASALFGLGVDLLSVASPVALWAGMVTGTLLGVVWVPMGGAVTAASPPGERGHDPGTAEGAIGVVAGDLSVLLDPPQRRLVPRDVLAPPEGWEVPDALPPRPARCEVTTTADTTDGRPSREG